ncbi:MAG: type I-B CRISPR-associated protein Cas8b1/Cst1 [Candidatus Omnitrophica bacterium]|nr:type I-B CRISPR-associated protein Cas8b1/Cst1 [Candidatus Omnitrophota bacterium]MCM8827951.1 type I-B CRISPR-associated protein Cas8b1/Cst1 [Candidatus Omnitrophota bacterium]
MKYKVYLRDWYFNAGIIGFLKIIADGRKLEDISYLVFGENYIEFNDDIFNGFEEKFIKHVFLKFFNVEAYLKRLQKAQQDLKDKKTKINQKQIVKKIGEIEKPPYKDFLKLLKIDISINKSVDNFIANLENAKKYIKSLNKETIFEKLNSIPEGRKSLQKFSEEKLKGLSSYKKERISEYIKKLKKTNPSKKLKNNKLCPSCQERKAEVDFNNAVSNIIGFNKDNSNWIWGFKSAKLNICPLCAIIYICAFASFWYISKKVDKNYLNYFYFPNANTTVKNLYEEIKEFNLVLDNIQDNNDMLYEMIKHTVVHIVRKQSKSIAENINFIEIADNPILAGQSSKGYNVYNYNIMPDIAEFLDEQFKASNIPKGYYIITINKTKKTFYSIQDELLKKAIRRQIDYSTLYRYFVFFLYSDRYTANYDLKKVMKFVIKYIQSMRGGNMEQEKSQTIVKKGFKSGIVLRDAILKKGKENQINGLVYGFLNDLKVADREKFLDKYIRVNMSYEQPIMFGQDEMLDDDYFLQFGYSFVNGLMSKSKEMEENTVNNKKEGE